MEAIREVTKWEGTQQPNHIYLMDGARAVAYIRFGQGKPERFKSGIAIDRRGRKFVPAERSLFEQETPSSLIQVQGSKGQVYWVDPVEKTCTCSGFQFRNHCRHLDAHTTA